MASKKRQAAGLLDPESEAIAEAYAAIPSVRRQAQGLLSLEPQQDQSMAQTALEAVLGFIPGVGQALAARDIERARRANDPAAAAMAATEFVPFGRLAGMMRRPGPIMSELDVYHGSPHKFDEFDASKIGTGEGAQAYGHGIYLAESPRVAKDYQVATSKDRFLTDNGYFDPSELEHLNLRVKARSGDLDAAIEAAKKFSVPDEDYPEAAAKAARDLKKLEALKARGGMRVNPGNFYTADLPDEMVDRMLDYDKPLKDQPVAYQAIRSTIPADVVKDFDANVEKGITGGNAYSNWVWGGKTPVGRSEKLRQLNIPGIKYADAGSRGQGGSGTRNFVVFPGEEKKVKIKKRE